MAIYKLKNEIKNYAWGSTTLIPEYLGIKGNGNPLAELWMGAHPAAMSKVVIDNKEIPLAEYIKKDPENILGKKAYKHFGDDFPFLFKVLAADKPLSIQAHPSKKQAEEGFAREEKAGVSLTAFNRNYKDKNHKPEIICALSDFYAMCGFRPENEIINNFQKYTGSETLVEDLISGSGDALRIFFNKILNLKEDEIKFNIDKILEKNDKSAILFWIKRMNENFGYDPGVLSPLFLNLIKLKPGEALFQEAGALHAYLSGIGIELMANSDNVLRGGLTVKHIDKKELDSVLLFKSNPPSPVKPQISSLEKKYKTDVKDFLLSRISINNKKIYSSDTERSLEIMICVSGKAEFLQEESGAALLVKTGESVIIPADCPVYKIKGQACLFKATVNL